jgi:DNA-directed RNA polymerase specialized sigma24 family protein
MLGRETTDAPGAVARPLFATTHWSVVLATADPDSPQARAALEELCRTYWYPLYCYIRRRGYGHEDAQDLTQGFLLRWLEQKSFARADASKGRLRSFLLAGLNHFLSDQWDRASAQKRGGGQPTLSLTDTQTADDRYRLEPVDERSPEKLFDRQWALTLLDQVLARAEEEFREAGKAELFQRLRVFVIAGTGEESYAQVGAELGMSREAVKKAVQRMRHRYYELFREEVAQTVADPAEVEEELRCLCAVIEA